MKKITPKITFFLVLLMIVLGHCSQTKAVHDVKTFELVETPIYYYDSITYEKSLLTMKNDYTEIEKPIRAYKRVKYTLYALTVLYTAYHLSKVLSIVL